MKDLTTYEKTLLEDLDKMNYDSRAKDIHIKKLHNKIKEKDQEIIDLKIAIAAVSKSLVLDIQNENKKLY